MELSKLVEEVSEYSIDFLNESVFAERAVINFVEGYFSKLEQIVSRVIRTKVELDFVPGYEVLLDLTRPVVELHFSVFKGNIRVLLPELFFHRLRFSNTASGQSLEQKLSQVIEGALRADPLFQRQLISLESVSLYEHPSSEALPSEIRLEDPKFLFNLYLPDKEYTTLGLVICDWNFCNRLKTYIRAVPLKPSELERVAKIALFPSVSLRLDFSTLEVATHLSLGERIPCSSNTSWCLEINSDADARISRSFGGVRNKHPATIVAELRLVEYEQDDLFYFVCEVQTMQMSNVVRDNEAGYTEAAASRREVIEGLRNCTVKLQVELGVVQLSVDELLELMPGSLVRLQLHSDDEVVLRVGSEVLASAKFVRDETSLCLQITSIAKKTVESGQLQKIDENNTEQ